MRAPFQICSNVSSLTFPTMASEKQQKFTLPLDRTTDVPSHGTSHRGCLDFASIQTTSSGSTAVLTQLCSAAWGRRKQPATPHERPESRRLRAYARLPDCILREMRRYMPFDS